MDALSGCFALDDMEHPVRGRLCPLHWPKAICKGALWATLPGWGAAKLQQGLEKVLLNVAKRGTDSVRNPRLISTHLST